MKTKLIGLLSLTLLFGSMAQPVMAKVKTQQQKQVITKQGKQPTVVEKFTMGYVKGMTGARVWVTKYGVLPTWSDLMSNNYGSFGAYDNFNPDQYHIPKSVTWYYLNDGPATNLAYNRTIYSKGALQFFKQFIIVPHFNVRPSQTVDLLSNGQYVYPNGKWFVFRNKWVQVSKSAFPTFFINPHAKYYFIFHEKNSTYYQSFSNNWFETYGVLTKVQS